ncbi:hypothetical protein [Streptomyces sp. NPDC056821]
MSLDMMTRAEAAKLPVFEEHAEHEIGAFYLWRGMTDPDHVLRSTRGRE